MRRFCVVVFFIIPLLSFAQQRNTLYNNYINQYYDIAIKQQTEHKIPASIILAQGLLESGAGQSHLAQKANNHFGIKCHDWEGKKIYHDDDKKNECFRRYDKVLDSYEDHSAFLVNRQRYSSLFQLDPTDYKGWAHGLKQAGYATDPRYANKLIAIIEEYELHRFDLMAADNITEYKKEKKTKSETTKERKKRERNRSIKNKNDNSSVIIDAFAVHRVEKNNGVKYVIARQGDTFGSIADEFSLKESKLLSHNDALEGSEPAVGEKVYIQRKKNKAAKGLERHTIKTGESFYTISQQYGIKLVDLYKINGFPYDQRAEIGKTIKIRP